MTANIAMSGGCQCGAIRFRIDEAPTSVYICHCRMCQKSVGGPFAGYAMLPLRAFSWTRGAPAEWASSSLGLRQFCGRCGTPLGYRYIQGPETGEQYLTTGCFDDFQSMVPRQQVGMESRNHWLDHLEQMPAKHTGASVGVDRLSQMVNLQHPDLDTPAHWKP